jgi:hypothetical protein
MNMEFASFAQALHFCMISEDGSPEQQEAMAYCLRHSPADLRAMLEKRFVASHDNSGHNCGCGWSVSDAEHQSGNLRHCPQPSAVTKAMTAGLLKARMLPCGQGNGESDHW